MDNLICVIRKKLAEESQYYRKTQQPQRWKIFKNKNSLYVQVKFFWGDVHISDEIRNVSDFEQQFVNYQEEWTRLND